MTDNKRLLAEAQKLVRVDKYASHALWRNRALPMIERLPLALAERDAALADAEANIADAWEEGFREGTGYIEGTDPSIVTNPYRAAPSVPVERPTPAEALAIASSRRGGDFQEVTFTGGTVIWGGSEQDIEGHWIDNRIIDGIITGALVVTPRTETKGAK